MADGPSAWQRVTVAPDGPKTDDRHLARVKPQQTIEQSSLPTATVSNVVQKDNSISFSVDKVGVPVLVKVSYFPNWKATGAQGPYRAAPNYMVVVPTKNRVTLTYTTSNIEYLGYVLTLLGIVLVFVLWRKGPLQYGPVTEGPVVWQDGQLVWHEEPPLSLPPEPEAERDITADHERFEVLADQVFGPPQGVPPVFAYLPADGRETPGTGLEAPGAGPEALAEPVAVSDASEATAPPPDPPPPPPASLPPASLPPPRPALP